MSGYPLLPENIRVQLSTVAPTTLTVWGGHPLQVLSRMSLDEQSTLLHDARCGARVVTHAANPYTF
jgi:hypothetical protein